MLGSELRADVDALNNTNFHTDRLFGLWAAPGFETPTRTRAYLLQGGLGMLDRDDYTNSDPKSADLQRKYREHVAAVLRLARFPTRTPARAASTRSRSASPRRTSRERTRSTCTRRTTLEAGGVLHEGAGPGLAGVLRRGGPRGQPLIIVWHPSAAVGISALAGKESLDTWKDYLTFHAVDRASTLLPRAFADEHFDFYGVILTGAKQPRDRWKRAVAATNVGVGFAVGRLYVQRYFPPEAKAQAQAMVENIRTAFRRRIDRLEWMSPATREKAKAKVGTLYVGIGYPERWRDYSGSRSIPPIRSATRSARSSSCTDGAWRSSANPWTSRSGR